MAMMVKAGSCGIRHCSAYSEALRWQIAYQCLELNFHVEQWLLTLELIL